MTLLHAIAIGAQVGAAATAVLLARRRADHRPVAIALVLLAAVVLARVVLWNVLRHARGELPDPSAPFTALGALAALYMDGALFMGPMAITPALVLAITLERPRRSVAGVIVVWVLASIALAAAYPSSMVRGAARARLFLAADLTGLFVAIVAFARWMVLLRSLSPAHMVAGLLVLGDLGNLLMPYSPWREGLFFGRYEGTQLLIALLFAFATLYQVMTWTLSRQQ